MPLKIIGVDASRASGTQMTGTEWYSREIIAALARIEDRPALRLYHRNSPLTQSGERVENVPIRQRRFWTHLGLAKEMTARPPDALFVPAHVIPTIHPAASVVTIHDVGHRFASRGHTFRRRLALEAATRWNVNQATRIIVPSQSTADDVMAAYGVPSDRIDVVHHGINPQRFRVLPDQELESTLKHLGIRRPYLLFLSTVQPRKNASRLISAFEALDIQDLDLVIAGADGWMSDPINARITQSARASNILRLGYVADDDIPALYNGARAFVLPSLYEGFGMGIVEAMACGCPVVSSSASSLPEIAGGAALIVDPHSVDAICEGIRAVIQPDQRYSLRKAGLKRSRHFIWERAAEQTLRSIELAYINAAGSTR